MYILWYAPEKNAYNLDFVKDVAFFKKSNILDILYRFEPDEKNVALGVLKNLNRARLAPA